MGGVVGFELEGKFQPPHQPGTGVSGLLHAGTAGRTVILLDPASCHDQGSHSQRPGSPAFQAWALGSTSGNGEDRFPNPLPPREQARRPPDVKEEWVFLTQPSIS